MATNVTTSYYENCQRFVSGMVLYSLYTIFKLLVLLPILSSVLVICFRRWKRRRSASAMSHTDVFTFHMTLVEFFDITGSVCYLLSVLTKNRVLLLLGIYVFCIVIPGQTLLHIVTSIERYAAVVHPITYMKLRDSHGVWLRNVSISCIWLTCGLWIYVTYVFFPNIPHIVYLFFLGLCMLLMVYFSLSLLSVVIPLGPRKVGGVKDPTNRSKQKAFHMIVAITAALLVRSLGLLIGSSSKLLMNISNEQSCAMMDGALLLSFPSSLVLPVLFLHRARKIPDRRRSRSRDK